MSVHKWDGYDSGSAVQLCAIIHVHTPLTSACSAKCRKWSLAIKTVWLWGSDPICHLYTQMWSS